MKRRTHSTFYERNAPAASVVEQSLAGSRQEVFWTQDAAQVKPQFERLTGDTRADLTVVGGGYAGLWTAALAKRRNPGAKVVLLEGAQVGWAASGRNGGFCEASLTHGEANGRERWPGEFDQLQELGEQNLDAFEADLTDWGIDAQFERTGMLSVALEPHQVAWLREEGEFLDQRQIQERIHSAGLLAGSLQTDGIALVHPARLAYGLAQAAAQLGVEMYEHTPVRGLDASGRGAVQVVADGGRVTSERVALATNVFPSLLRRKRLMTVPVYDYVLMTEPLSEHQRASIGWAGREGLSDLANQFHYSRLTADGRILFGGYDAIYHRGRQVRPEYEDRPQTYRALASHLFALFPQLEGLGFSHRWAGAIDTCTQFCAFHGTSHNGRVAYAAGFTGLGVGATRFAAEVMLDQLSGQQTQRTRLQMVRKQPLPFPPEPLASLGINLVRHSLDRADHRQGNRNLLLRSLDRLGLGFDS